MAPKNDDILFGLDKYFFKKLFGLTNVGDELKS